LSSAATAAEDDRVEVDDVVELLLSSAPSPYPRWKIRGQRHAIEVLDCLRHYDGGWWRPWLAVAAGGAAMASSAGGDIKGGQLQSRSIFPEQNCWQRHAIADYGDITACYTMCSMR